MQGIHSLTSRFLPIDIFEITNCIPRRVQLLQTFHEVLLNSVTICLIFQNITEMAAKTNSFSKYKVFVTFIPIKIYVSITVTVNVPEILLNSVTICLIFQNITERRS